MRTPKSLRWPDVALLLTLTALLAAHYAAAQAPKKAVPKPLPDAVQEAQTPRETARTRPEQQLSEHDRSKVFLAPNAPPSSTALKTQPQEGQVTGFDFYRDPLDSKKPMQSPDEIKAADKEAKPKVMEAQRELLEKRYILTPKLDPEVKMSRGKPLAVGPTARL